MKNKIKFLSLLMVAAATSSFATISNVTVQAGTNSGAQNKSFTHSVSNNRIGGFRLPFIAGLSHIVTFSGAFVDVCSRVEICNSGGSVQHTLSGASLTKSTVSGVGQLKFTISTSNLPAAGNDFIIKVRYAVELNGFDQLDGKVVKRGIINSMEWVGTQPLISSASGGESSVLRIGTAYQLRFNGTGFPSSIQLFDGLHTNLFKKAALPYAGANLTISGSTAMTLSIAPTGVVSSISADFQDFSDAGKSLLWADGDIGNIIGGWGPYVYFDYNNLLATTGNLTDVKFLSARPASDFNPELTIDAVTKIFRSPNSNSSSVFASQDLAQYQLCNASPTANVKITTIPPMEITIRNSGFAQSPAFQLQLTNINGTGTRQIAVPAIQGPGTTKVNFNRAFSDVCGQGTGSSTGCVRCSDAVSGNIIQWNDLGIRITIPAIPNEQNPGNNVMIIQ